MPVNCGYWLSVDMMHCNNLSYHGMAGVKCYVKHETLQKLGLES